MLEVGQRTAREVNRRLAGGTERFAFYHERGPWLSGLLAKGDLFLSRIGWPPEGGERSSVTAVDGPRWPRRVRLSWMMGGHATNTCLRAERL